MKQSGRSLYRVSEAYGIVYQAMRSIPKLKKALHQKRVSEQFKERIMLAVTRVNGCAMCSYAHTQMALESGMSEEEISRMLAGDDASVPKQEAVAILFAQTYADTRGKPSRKSWEKLVETYGKEKASAILAAIRVIMMGNTYGIPFGSLKGRLKKDRQQIDSRSSVPYEYMMMLSLIIYLPVGLFHALLVELFSIVT